MIPERWHRDAPALLERGSPVGRARGRARQPARGSGRSRSSQPVSVPVVTTRRANTAGVACPTPIAAGKMAPFDNRYLRSVVSEAVVVAC